MNKADIEFQIKIEKAVDQAIANLCLEGYNVTEEEIKVIKKELKEKFMGEYTFILKKGGK